MNHTDITRPFGPPQKPNHQSNKVNLQKHQRKLKLLLLHQRLQLQPKRLNRIKMFMDRRKETCDITDMT